MESNNSNAKNIASNLMKNAEMNATINNIIYEIMEDGIINYKDIPNIIILYTEIKKTINKEHLPLKIYIDVIKIIICSCCSPLLGEVSQHLLLKILDSLGILILSGVDVVENNCGISCCC